MMAENAGGGGGARYGVLLLQMGGPDDLDGVRDFIYQLLADSDMVKFPGSRLLGQPLAALIAKFRTPKVKKRYALIGGKSPINEATAEQTRLVADKLGLPVDYAMRYTPPPVSQALGALRAQGAERLIVIPLYPQYSTVSTLSARKDFDRQNLPLLPLRFVERHYDDPTYIGGMQAMLRGELAKLDPALPSHLLFVAHSIPEAYVRQGDTYTTEIEATGELICAGVPEAPPHSLAYQSQVGPVEWRGPDLPQALALLLKQGVKQLVVQPLSFVSECLETIYDLDIDFRKRCAAAGITAYFRVPTAMDADWYAEALAGIARREIAAWEAAGA